MKYGYASSVSRTHDSSMTSQQSLNLQFRAMSEHWSVASVFVEVRGTKNNRVINSFRLSPKFVILSTHWGSSHEGSGRHPRQHGGGCGRRFSKFMANSHNVCSLLRLSFCELIVNVMGHIEAKFRAAVIRHLAAIPAWSFTRRRGCRSCLFSRGRGCRSALTRVPLYADERRASLILRTAAKLGTVYIFLDTKSY